MSRLPAMVLPNFLVIGAQRCGSTTLHTILDEHDEVYVPTRRKELHFFDDERNYARGIGWYEEFFPPSAAAAAYRAIGEVTPDYLFAPQAAPRIAALLPDCRLIVLLRNPVDRAFSGYLHHVRILNERRDFDQFFAEQVDARDRGFYTRQLQRFQALVAREQLHVMISEELFQEPRRVLERLAAFLNLSRAWREPERLARIQANRSELPYFRSAFLHARQLGERLTNVGLDRAVTRAKEAGVTRLFGRQPRVPRMPASSRRRLESLYRDEVLALEAFLGRSIEAWK